MSEQAKITFDTICQAIDSMGWQYQRNDAELTALFGLNCNDMPVNLMVSFDKERQIAQLLAKLPFEFGEDKRIEGAIGICAINIKLVCGSFDYDLSSGAVMFKMAFPVVNCTVSKDNAEFLVGCSAAMVDTYCDKLFSLSKGMLSIKDFLEAID